MKGGMKTTRRDFLRWMGGGVGAMAWGTFPQPFARRLEAMEPEGDRKLLFLFQMGGNDGINTVIPRGDPEYNAITRPTLFIPEAQALDLGNGFAQLHPRMAPLMEIYDRVGLTGRAGPGNLAVLHRIGYRGQSRSHFDSQQYWQNGVPGDAGLEEGFLYRRLALTTPLADPQNPLVAAALSSAQMVALKGAQPIPNFSRPEQFNVLGNASRAAKFLGQLPGPDGLGSGLLGLYGGAEDAPGRPYRALIHGTGRQLGGTIGALQEAMQSGTYVPENGAVYPTGSLGDKLRLAAMLFKRTEVQVVGLNVGGWDLHSRQGQINGEHGRLLGEVALGFQALHRDLQAQWDRMLLVTMTEFGRTSRENGAQGTDHAESSVMLVAGGGVKGGVYNCDATRWAAGDLFSKSERYVALRTDFRAVFGEIFTGHFGDPTSLLESIMPGYGAAAVADPAGFVPLGFLG